MGLLLGNYGCQHAALIQSKLLSTDIIGTSSVLMYHSIQWMNIRRTNCNAWKQYEIFFDVLWRSICNKYGDFQLNLQWSLH